MNTKWSDLSPIRSRLQRRASFVLFFLALIAPSFIFSVASASVANPTAAEILLQALQASSESNSQSSSNAAVVISPDTKTAGGYAAVPLGVSLGSQGSLNSDLVPSEAVVPQASAIPASTATTKVTPTTTAAVTPTVAATNQTAQVTTPSSSISDSDKAALIATLLAEVQVLEAKIVALQAAQAAATPAASTATSVAVSSALNTSSCSPLTLTRSLALGSTGSDVTALQNFLISQGYLNSTATGYFGSLTQAAVSAFQSETGITAVGSVGPITTAKISSISSACQSTAKNNSLPAASVTANASSTTTAATTTAPIIPVVSLGGGSSSPPADTTPPTVSLTAPSGGATVSGSSVTLSANASDDVAVAGVSFYVNNTLVGSEDTSSPYSVSWDSTAIANGSKSIVAVARDTSNNYATSSSVTVTLSNSGPAIFSISSGTPGQTGTTISWTSSIGATSKVVYGTTSSYGSASSSVSLLTSHSIILSGLTASTVYHFAVVSADSFGNTSTSSDQSFSTSGGGGGGADTTSPSRPANVIATPSSSSAIGLSWTASSDNVAVVGYKIYRDGTQIATSTSGTTYNDTGLAGDSLHAYWVAAYDAAGNVSAISVGVNALTQAGADQFGTVWKPLRVGAGGYVPGIDIEADGTRVIRTDAGGAYVWDGTQWDQLVTSLSMPAGDYADFSGAGGVYEIKVAPSNTNRFYMMFNGYVYRTDNRGVTWTKTNLTQVSANANGSFRGDGPRIAIDPNNADVVFVGTDTNGVWESQDAGADWTQVTALGTSALVNGNPPGYGMVYDPTSSVVNGKTQGIYVATYGTGVYHSTNGGATWTLTSGGPATFERLAIGPDGTLYVVSDDGSVNLYMYSSGTWSSVNTSTTPHVVAVDPRNANHIVVANFAGGITVSNDHGATFGGGESSGTLASPDVPWLINSGGYMTSGDLAFDPTQNDVLYQSVGDGVVYTSPPTTNVGVAITWTFQSKGIEELVTNEIISPPGGNPLVASWDRAVFDITNPDVFPSDYGPHDSFDAGWALAYAQNDPSYIVGVLGFFNADGDSGYSTDGGQTWTNFATEPACLTGALGGTLAAASSTDIVVFPENNVQPCYTLDGGRTWSQITMPGVPTSGETGFGWAYYLNRPIVAADPVNIGTYYAYNYGVGGYPSSAGIFTSTDGGVTWTRVYDNTFASSGFNASLKAMPGKVGELFFTSGSQSGWTINADPGEVFEHSTDGGATWSAVPNVTGVFTFGFGKAAPGHSSAAIYLAGYVNGVYGIWESDDDAVTWTRVGLWANNLPQGPSTISGDMNAYGRVYVGFGGEGSAYGDTANAQIPPLFSAISAGTPAATSDTVTWTTNISSDSKVVYGTTNAYGLTASNGSFVTSHSVNLSGLTAATTYHYAVVSSTSQGYTATSTDHTFQTFDATPPSTPSGLSATTVSAHTINLSWTGSSDNVGVAGYKIYISGTQMGTSTGTGTTYASTDLIASTTYSYTVAAYDGAGNTSSQSGSASATTQAGVTFTPTDSQLQFVPYNGPGTATFSTVNIGTPSSDRVVVVGITDSGNNLVTGVTVGGVSATSVGINAGGVSMWYANIPSGSTAPVVLTATNNQIDNIGIMVGDIVGESQIAPTATSTHDLPADQNDTGDPEFFPNTGTITVPANGLAVLVGGSHYNGGTNTWTNTTSALGDFNIGTPNNNQVSGEMAHSYATGAQSYTLSSSQTASGGFQYLSLSGIVATWKP